MRIFYLIFLLFCPHHSKGFLDLVVNVNFNLIIQKLAFEFKFVLNNALTTIQAQNQHEIDDLKHKIDQDFSIIEHELQSLTKQIKQGFANIDKDLKMNSLIELISKQTSYMDRFQVLVNTKSNSSDFIDQLDDFMKDYKRENIEDFMVNLIETKTQETSSLVEALIKAAKIAENETVSMRTSPNRLVYDFYMSMALNVYRGYYFMETCALMKDILLKKLNENEHDYFRSMTKLTIEKLIKSMKRVSSDFDYDPKYRTSYKQTINSTAFYSPTNYYMGISKAPEGFVISGMRFQLYNNSILYIQVQVAQMIDHGEVNYTNIHWQEPNEDIEVNVLNLNSGDFVFNFGNVHFNDAVLTGIQFKYFNNHLTTVAYGHKVINNNLGILDTTITKTELSETENNNFYKFPSDDIELNIKSPLSGLSFYHNSDNIIIPRLITYNTQNFIENIDIDASIKNPMSEFAKEKIRGMIHETKPEKPKLWVYIISAVSVSIVIMIIVIVFIVIAFKKREVNIRESLIYDTVYNN